MTCPQQRNAGAPAEIPVLGIPGGGMTDDVIVTDSTRDNGSLEPRNVAFTPQPPPIESFGLQQSVNSKPNRSAAPAASVFPASQKKSRSESASPWTEPPSLLGFQVVQKDLGVALIQVDFIGSASQNPH